MDSNKRFYLYTLLAISVFLAYIAYHVIKPFIVPILWAGVLSILFYPLYEFLRKRLRWATLAALVSLIIILLIIIGPFSYLSIMLTNEIKDLVGSIEAGEPFGLKRLMEIPAVSWLLEKVNSIFGMETAALEKLLRDNLATFGQQIADKVKAGVKNLLAAAIDFVFIALTTFFFLRDGPRILKRLRDYLPFEAEQRGRLEQQVKDMVVSTIFGGVVVALVQGIMGGTAFYFLDVPSPVIWGTAISIMSFIPFLGTFSVWGAIVLYLLFKGAMAKAVVLIFIGTFGISLVDNILKPIIIGERTKMPPLLILFSVLGGMKLFGFLGLIMGPMSVALFLSVFDISRNLEGGTYD